MRSRTNAALPNVIQLKLLDGGADTYPAMMARAAARAARRRSSCPSARGRSSAKRIRPQALRLDGARSCGRTGTGSARWARSTSRTSARRGACARRSRCFSRWRRAAGRARSGTALLSRRRGRSVHAPPDRRSCAVAATPRSRCCASTASRSPRRCCSIAAATAYTWKTAFDAEFAKFSPGALLIDKVTDALFADGIAEIKSCSSDGGFMENLWTGRRMTVDLLADVGAQKFAELRARRAGRARLCAGARGRDPCCARSTGCPCPSGKVSRSHEVECLQQQSLRRTVMAAAPQSCRIGAFRLGRVTLWGRACPRSGKSVLWCEALDLRRRPARLLAAPVRAESRDACRFVDHRHRRPCAAVTEDGIALDDGRIVRLAGIETRAAGRCRSRSEPR